MESKAKIVIPTVMGVGLLACVAVSYFSSSLNAFDKYEIITTESVDGVADESENKSESDALETVEVVNESKEKQESVDKDDKLTHTRQTKKTSDKKNNHQRNDLR